KEKGIENILALRGDIPANADFPLPNQYHHASELISEIRAQGDFCIGGACYPEGHPEAETIFEDLDHLKEKVEAGCEFLTTQMFFDNNILYNFMYKALKRGIDVPVVAGIMPVTNASQIKRIVSLSGNMVPPRFLAIVDRFKDDPKAMRQAGIAYTTEQIIDLIANGVNHVHIYTMNKPDIAAAIFENLSDIYVRE
uniref:methylenetetrahydrofolate reductase n=1 Tax=Roseburia sp. TaxID=2049040 RepID=UPI003FF137BC